MSSAPVSAGEAVLAAVQDAALGIVRPYDSEQATRLETALEALAPTTHAASTAARWRPDASARIAVACPCSSGNS